MPERSRAKESKPWEFWRAAQETGGGDGRAGKAAATDSIARAAGAGKWAKAR